MLLILIGLNACGAPQGDAPAAGDLPGDRIDACALLAAAEVGTALGSDVGEPMRTDREVPTQWGPALTTVCNYGGFGDGVAVTVRQFPVAQDQKGSQEWAEEARQRYESDPDETGTPTIDFEPFDVAGHAGVAHLWDDFTVAEVYVHGTGAIQVGVSAPTTEAAVDLARLAVTRLPG